LRARAESEKIGRFANDLSAKSSQKALERGKGIGRDQELNQTAEYPTHGSTQRGKNRVPADGSGPSCGCGKRGKFQTGKQDDKSAQLHATGSPRSVQRASGIIITQENLPRCAIQGKNWARRERLGGKKKPERRRKKKQLSGKRELHLAPRCEEPLDRSHPLRSRHREEGTTEVQVGKKSYLPSERGQTAGSHVDVRGGRKEKS